MGGDPHLVQLAPHRGSSGLWVCLGVSAVNFAYFRIQILSTATVLEQNWPFCNEAENILGCWSMVWPRSVVGFLAAARELALHLYRRPPLNLA